VSENQSPRYFEIIPRYDEQDMTETDWREVVSCAGYYPSLREVVPAAGPWQPIAEAPKDGSVMLLRDEDGSWWKGYWYAGSGQWLTSLGNGALTPTHFALINPVPAPKEENDGKETV
jgi:hypothetical protein